MTFLDALESATGTIPRRYATNAVPSSPQYPYQVHSVIVGRGDTYTLNGRHGVRHGRIVLQHFGRTLQSALALAEAASTALLDVSLDVAGYDCTPCRIELDPAIVRDPDDDGVVGVTTTLTFTATKEQA